MKAVTYSDEKTKAEAFLKVDDGVSTIEHNGLTAEDGAFCAWVPVATGQKISVDAACYAATNEIQFDLVVDGILRNTVRVQSKEWKNERRNGKFSTLFRMEGSKTVDAEMFVKDLAPEAYPSTQANDGDTVGSIEIRIYVLQHEKEVRHQQPVKTFMQCLEWKDACPAPTYTAVCPTQEIELPAFIIQSTAQKLTMQKLKVNAERAGTKPWVVFRFFYRKQDDINNGGLIKTNKKHVFRFNPPSVVMPEGEASTGYGGDDEEEITSEATGSEVDSFEVVDSFYDVEPTADSEEGGAIEEADEVTQPIVPHPDNNNHVHEPASPIEDDIQKPLSPASSIDPTSPPQTPKPKPNFTKISPRVIIPMAATTMTAPVATMMAPTVPMTTKSARSARSRSKTPGTEVKLLASDPAEQRAEAIRKYNENIGDITHMMPIAQDLLIKTQAAESPGSTPVPEEKFSSAISTPTSFKRKAACTPDTANKKLKEENDTLEKMIATKRRMLAEKKKVRLEMQKKAEDAETKRKAELQRMLEELDDEMDAEDELTEQAEFEYQESENATLVASRKHSMTE